MMTMNAMFLITKIKMHLKPSFMPLYESGWHLFNGTHSQKSISGRSYDTRQIMQKRRAIRDGIVSIVDNTHHPFAPEPFGMQSSSTQDILIRSYFQFRVEELN